MQSNFKTNGAVRAWGFVKAVLVMTAFLMASSVAKSQDEPTRFEKIKSDGVLKVAVYNNLLPFSDKGKGIDVELANALAAEMGLKTQILPFDADESFGDDLRNMVWRGSLFGYGPGDVMMHSPIDDYLIKNEDKVEFFGAYTREEIFVARNLDRLPTLDSLDVFASGEFKIGAEVASIASEVLAGADGRAYVSNLRNYKNPQMAVEAMVKGEIDAVMATRSELEGALFKVADKDKYYISKVRHNSLPPNGWAVGMAVKKSNKDLAIALNAALESLKSKGELEKIFARYGVTYRKP